MASKKRKYITASAQKRYRKEEESKKRAAFLKQNQKKIVIGIIALIVVCVLFWLSSKLLWGPGGSIPNFFGKLQGVKENWIVTNLGTTSKPKYFKLGEYNDPEGYTLDPTYQVSTDSRNQTKYYTADDENAAVSTVYISGVKENTAAEMMETIMGYGYYTETNGTETGVLGGKDAVYAYFLNQETDEDTGDLLDTGYANITVYVDTIKDSCILVYLNSAKGNIADAPSEEAMLAEAEAILQNLTVPTK